MTLKRTQSTSFAVPNDALDQALAGVTIGAPAQVFEASLAVLVKFAMKVRGLSPAVTEWEQAPPSDHELNVQRSSPETSRSLAAEMVAA